jgi:hypothetical protein
MRLLCCISQCHTTHAFFTQTQKAGHATHLLARAEWKGEKTNSKNQTKNTLKSTIWYLGIARQGIYPASVLHTMTLGNNREN